MKHILLSIFALVFTGVQLFAQDVITLQNNKIIDAKNIVVADDIIKYQNYYDNNGKVLNISKAKVSSIQYQNGSKLDISETKTPILQKNTKKNLLTFHFLDFVINDLAISYERLIADGKYGIQIPFSFGYSNHPTEVFFPYPTGDLETYTNKLTSNFYTGITFNVYPTGQGKVKYFLGPSIRIGSGKYYTNWDNYHNENKYSSINTGYVKFFINNGIVFTFVNSLSISIIGSIGIQHMFKVNENAIQTSGALSTNISYRF